MNTLRKDLHAHLCDHGCFRLKRAYYLASFVTHMTPVSSAFIAWIIPPLKLGLGAISFMRGTEEDDPWVVPRLPFVWEYNAG